MKNKRLRHLFKYMAYDAITERQHLLVISFEKQFLAKGRLSERQIEILEDIFEQGARKEENRKWWE